MKRIKKRYYAIVVILLSLFSLLFFASTIAKNYLEKHSEELVGRKINLEELHFNYWDAAINIKGFRLFEANKKRPFVSFNELHIDLNPWKLLHSEISFSEFKIKDPYIAIIQKDSTFNFSDMIDFFERKLSNDTVVSNDTVQQSMKYSISNFELTNGYIHYADKKKNTTFDLKKLGLAVPFIAWDSKRAKMGINFKVGKGDISIASDINPATKFFIFKIKSSNLALAPITPYVTDFMNISRIDGYLSSNFLISGNYGNGSNIKISGDFGVKEFSLKDKNSRIFLAAENATTHLKSIHLDANRYHISSVNIYNPYIYGELVKTGTNFDDIFAPYYKMSSTEYVEVTKDNKEKELVYLLDTFKIMHGKIDFIDYTLNRNFTYKMSNINMTMTNIAENSRKIPIKYDVTCQRSGTIKGTAIYDRVQPMNLKTNFSINNIDLISFSPYTEFYVGRPIIGGHLNYRCQLTMNPKLLKNENDILIKQVDFGKKVNKNPVVKVPVMLGLYLLKDTKGNVDMNIPVTGNPTDPEFSYWKILWKTLANVLVKSAVAPFKLLGDAVGVSDSDAMKNLGFAIIQDSLSPDITKKLDKVVALKAKKPQLTFVFTQVTDVAKEKEKLAVEATKRSMILSRESVTDETILINSINNTADNDSLFVKYVAQQLSTSNVNDIKTACKTIQGEGKLNIMLEALLTKRNELVKNYLISKGIAATDFKVETGDLQNLPDEDKTPKHIIEINFK